MSLTRIKPSPDVLFRELGDDLVLLDLQASKYFSLNKTGALIWQLLSENQDQSSIARNLADRYGVDEEKAQSDVAELLDQLLRAGLISAED